MSAFCPQGLGTGPQHVLAQACGTAATTTDIYNQSRCLQAAGEALSAFLSGATPRTVKSLCWDILSSDVGVLQLCPSRICFTGMISAFPMGTPSPDSAHLLSQHSSFFPWTMDSQSRYPYAAWPQEGQSTAWTHRTFSWR